jgi:hypothetical protein
VPSQLPATGTPNAFKQLFQFPEKLVTETGDVIPGWQEYSGDYKNKNREAITMSL